jgi:4'-phosphopantetheinyl transferase
LGIRQRSEKACLAASFHTMAKKNKSRNRDSFETRVLPLSDLLLPAAGEVHLWYLDLVSLGNPLRLQAGAARPEAGEMTPRQVRTVRRFYTRLLLGAYLGLPGKDVHLIRSVRGKPALDPGKHPGTFRFSLTSSHGRCLVGISVENDVGVDLELADRKPGNALAVARRYFSMGEAEQLAAIEPGFRDRAFIRTWACKEAVVKASGAGIANSLCRFSVETDPRHPPALLEIEDDEPQAWSLVTIHPEAGFLAAVALRYPQAGLRSFRLQHATSL